MMAGNTFSSKYAAKHNGAAENAGGWAATIASLLIPGKVAVSLGRGASKLGRNGARNLAKVNPCNKNSFEGETPVLMCDGSHKQIAEIEPGDWVVARDVETDEVGCFPVTHTWSHPDSQVHELVVRDPETGAEERHTVTHDHPMILPDGSSIEVQYLEPGTRLGSIESGYVEVIDNSLVAYTIPVYNLTVDGAHSYFVGENGTWAHNCNFVFTLKQLGNNVLVTAKSKDGELAGTAYSSLKEGVMESVVAVEKNFRRQGVGSEMGRRTIEAFGRDNVKYISGQINAGSDNFSALISGGITNTPFFKQASKLGYDQVISLKEVTTSSVTQIIVKLGKKDK